MKRGLDSYKLKLIALIFMIVDHVYAGLNVPLHADQRGELWPEWIPVITRFVSPLFLYLMVEGFYHTRSRRKYVFRLFTAGLIMMAGNIAINYMFHNVDQSTGKYSFRSLTQGHDIFLTLADLFVFIWCLEKIKHKEKIVPCIILAIVIALFSLILEGGFYLLPVAVVTWLFYGKKSLQCAGIGVWCAFLMIKALISHYSGGTVISLYSDLCFDNEWAMFLAIFFILLYNGERGRNTRFTKYLFYIIYPIHLWALMIIRFIIE
jgi:hypothetical protein